MHPIFTTFQFALLGLALLLNTPFLFANNTIALVELLDEQGKITNPLNLTGSVDFSSFYPVMDDCEGLVFLPPPLAPGWNALGTGLSSDVYDIAISGSDVYVAGNFTNAGGNAQADYIARWDGSNWHALGTGLSHRAWAIAISGSNVYVGGDFFFAGGVANTSRIARWDGSAWRAVGTGLGDVVYAITISGSDVYVGGSFTNAGGNSNADRIARWNGSTWNALGSGLGTGLGDVVEAIAISGSDVYVGGSFPDAGGNTNADNIARWDGSTWNALGSGLNNGVKTIAISGSNVYVGGFFTDAGGNIHADFIARWNGSTWNTVGSGLNFSVWAIAIYGSDVYVGGSFTNAGGNPDADRIVRRNGTTWNALGTGLNNSVYAIAISGSDVYVGGYFTNAGGNPDADGITRWEESILPVELTDFFAHEKDGAILLNWHTSSEINNHGFDLERSSDGSTWEFMGFVEGQGATAEAQSYFFRDENPVAGINYYRLRQMDFDGQFEYSKIINITFKGVNREVGEFYPNPSKLGLVNLEYTSQSDEAIVISVFDATGKLVLNEIQQVADGSNNLSFDFSDLNTGIYFVKIGGETNPTHRKLIIER